MKINRYIIRSGIKYGLVVFLAFISSSRLVGEMVPEAQDDIEKGKEAAQMNNNLDAVAWFEAARQFAPNAPEVYGNLGLVESRMAGREPRAICWFGAYLSLAPSSPNAAAVKSKIDALDAKYKGYLVKLTDKIENAAKLISTNKQDHLAQVIDLRVLEDDISGAQRVADLSQDEYWKNLDEAEIASMQLRMGNTKAAMETAKLIIHAGWKAETLGKIVKAQANSGDIDGAKATALQIESGSFNGVDIDCSYYQKAAQTDIAAAKGAKSTKVTPLTMTDWLGRLNDADSNHVCSLKTDLFLDHENQLKASNSDSNPESVFSGLYFKVRIMAEAICEVDRLLVKQQKQKTILINGSLSSPGSGKHKYEIYPIDTLACTNGGTIIIKAKVGAGDCAGSFDLFNQTTAIPTEGSVKNSVAHIYDLQPNHSRSLNHHFNPGDQQIFQLGAEGNWSDREGTTNSFLASVYVIMD